MIAIYELMLAALYRVKNVCQLNDAALLLIPEAVIERDRLDNIIIRIEDAKAINMADLSNIAVNKEIIQKIMVDTVHRFALRASVKANQINNTELEVALGIPRSAITENDDAAMATKCEELMKIMKNNLLTLTNLEQADIDAMVLAIKNYKNVLAAPKDAAELRKAQGTDALDVLFVESDIPKNNIIKIFHSYLPAQAHTMDIAARIGKPIGARYTSVAVLIFDAVGKMPLKGVKCTITDGTDTFVKSSTYRGWVRYYSLPNALWSLTIEYHGYKTVIHENIATIEKKMVSLKFDLEKETTDTGDPETTTGIIATTVYLKEGGTAQGGVQISIPGLNYVSTTDEDGEDYSDENPPGDYPGTIFFEGYKLITFIATVKAGQTTTLKFYLEPDEENPPQ